MNQTIRQQVIEAARIAILCMGPHEFYMSRRAGRYFDIALAAEANEYTAAEIALKGLAFDYGERAAEFEDPRSSAMNDAPRAWVCREAQSELKAASRRFRLAGEQAAFDRLVEKARELAA